MLGFIVSIVYRQSSFNTDHFPLCINVFREYLFSLNVLCLMKLLQNLSLCCLLMWLQGMACVGRTKECTIVPSNHYGPIPGVPVGTTWKFRVQVSCLLLCIDKLPPLIFSGFLTCMSALIY